MQSVPGWIWAKAPSIRQPIEDLSTFEWDFEVETKGISTTNLQWVSESGFITVVWICFPRWILRAVKAFGCPSLTIWFCHFLAMLCCFFCQIKFTGILPRLTETWTAWIFQRKASMRSNRTGFLFFFPLLFFVLYCPNLLILLSS